jgi:phosphomannomutase
VGETTFAWPDSVIATHSGLRGRPGQDLTPDLIRRAVEGLAALLVERGAEPSVGVARDERPQGRRLAQDVISVACDAGLDVVDFGAASTPTAKLAARLRGLGGVIAVTASHLGPEWNGLKLVAGPDYAPVDLRRLPTPAPARSQRLGRLRADGAAAADHAEALCGSVDSELIRAAALRVAWSGGVGSLPRLVLERLGCKTDGSGHDASVLLDPDGDRLQLADEQGELLDPEVVLPLVALSRRPHTLVKGADTSRMVDDVLAARGGRVHVVTPGELHLVQGVVSSGAELAGEGNGGVLIPSVGMARDALAAAVTILELRAASGSSLSRLVSELPPYAWRRSTVPCPGDEAASQALASLAARLGIDAPDDPEEGIRVDTGHGTWGLVRRSATEPVLRVTTEARDLAAANQLYEELLAGLVDGIAKR